MCIFATSSIYNWSNESCPTLCLGLFLCPICTHHSGAQPRELVVMANSAPIMKLDNGKWAPSFFLPASQNHNYMNTSKNRPATSKKEQHFKPVQFNYEGKNIDFKDQQGSVMVNATQMGKLFGKRPNDWLRLQSTDEFLKALKDSQNADMRSGLFENEKPLFETINGGNNRGTWMHEDVALEFSRWLHPKFAIWTNKHIKELLLKGSTSIKQEAKGYPALPPKRKHNRLTTTRLLDIMVDITKIEDAELRLSLTKKLGL